MTGAMEIEVPTCWVKKVKGGKVQIHFEDIHFKKQYVDEYTGEVLQHDLIKAAIIEELTYFCEKEVWKLEDVSDMAKIKDHVLVRSRWVLCNKGDAQSPDMRARLVACEVNHGQRNDAFYASTPPLESKKALFSMYATEQSRLNSKGEKMPLRLLFIDIKKAYVNAIPVRDVYMRLPGELGLSKDVVGKQTRCVYGTRDAGMLWEETYRVALENVGFQSGLANPCLFNHAEFNIQVVVHGDDFTFLGNDQDLQWCTEIMEKEYEVKVRGKLGPDKSHDKSMIILNRSIV